MYCFSTVASETIRRGVVGGAGPGSVSVTLEPVPNPTNRTRAAARYRVRVAVPGGPALWVDGVWLVDGRGYFLEWSFQDVGKWLVKSLSGVPVVVNLTVSDASGLPAKWTAARLAALDGKVSALSAPGVLAEAAAKVASVKEWAVSERRTAVEQAAARMVEAAALVVQVHAMQAGEAWGVVPDPVDPVDPPYVAEGDLYLNFESHYDTKIGPGSDVRAMVDAEAGKSFQISFNGAVGMPVSVKLMDPAGVVLADVTVTGGEYQMVGRTVAGRYAFVLKSAVDVYTNVQLWLM